MDYFLVGRFVALRISNPNPKYNKISTFFRTATGDEIACDLSMMILRFQNLVCVIAAINLTEVIDHRRAYALIQRLIKYY